MKKAVSIILSFSILISLSACSQTESGSRFSKTFLDLFDTASSVMAYDTSEKAFDSHFELFYNELETYAQLYDIYNSYSGVVNLKYINDNAAVSPVKVDKKIMDLLVFGKNAYEISGGRVNICMGSVLSVWHDKREQGISNPENAELPDMRVLIERSYHTDIESLVLDTENMTVYFSDPDMKIDAGAVAKGFAAERIAEYVSEKGIWQSAVITLGGNVKTIGYKNNDGCSPFNIGIENPDMDDYLATVAVNNGMSVVSSGDYQRYYTVDGVEYCHIINPETLMPADKTASVSVLAKDSAYADMLSTALFIMSVDEGMEFVEKTDDAEAVWLDKNGNLTYSSGFSDYLVK